MLRGVRLLAGLRPRLAVGWPPLLLSAQRPLGGVGLTGPRCLSTSSSSSSSSSSNISAQGGGASVEADYQQEITDILQDYDERKERRQSLVGTIVSTKNKKTISVRVLRERFFPKYNKVLSARKKIMAHDEEEIGNVGDVVRIVPCRPMSKMKRHRIIDVLKVQKK